MAISPVSSASPSSVQDSAEPDVQPLKPLVVQPPPEPKPSLADQLSASGFDGPRPSAPRAAKGDSFSAGRGTADDSIGRKTGTSDDSIGRKAGTSDDSIGRKTGTSDDSVGTGTLNPADRSMFLDPEVFDAQFYAAHNPDLARAGITTATQLEQHWLEHGIAEGRQAAQGFDYQWCKSEYERVAPQTVVSQEAAIRNFMGLSAEDRAQTPTSAFGVETHDGRVRNTDGDAYKAGALAPKVLAGLEARIPASAKAAYATATGASQRSKDAVVHMLGTDEFRKSSADVQGRLIKLAATTGEAGAQALARLCDTPGILSATDTKGGTVLSSFEKMAKSTNPDVRKVLTATMADVANPSRIWQGDMPTCTVTSMQYELAAADPPEYARLMAGLAVDGRVQMAGGATMDRVKTDLSDRGLNTQRRTASEALFQDAAMDFANGDETYDTTTQRSVRADGTTHLGLKGEMIRTMAEQLSGQPYERHEIDDDQTAAAYANQLSQNASMNHPVLIDLDMGSYNHCVAFESAGAGKVTVRDPETGRTETLTLADFNQRAVAVYSVPEPTFEQGGGGD